jgi:ABC-type glycerol-3-phosphate transport system substrate-binding protein
MSKSVLAKLVGLVLVTAFILGACSTPTATTPAPTTPPQIVEVTKIVEGTTIVETQQVVVTATTAPTANPYDDKAPIKIMADTTRAPAVDLFVKAHPESKDLIQYMTDDRGQFLSKLLLYNNVGSGWMDVIFHETSTLRLSATTQYDNFMADLTPWVDPALVKQFYPGANAPCTLPDGKLICLRNDIAPQILYANVKNLKAWNYTVPATWEEFYSLAQKVAKDHPGTLMGSTNNWIPEKLYFAGSECPYMNMVNPTTYYINWLDPKCDRMTKLLDDLQKLGVMDLNGAFAAGTATKFQKGEWLFWVGAAWEADFIIKGVFLDPTKDEFKGVVGMYPMPKWADQSQIWTGSGGGAAWGMSRHTKNPKLAAALITFVTTDPSVTSVAVTLSAFQPGGDAWAKQVVSRNPLIAADPDPYATLNTMGAVIWPDILEGPPDASAVIAPFAADIMAGKKTWADAAKDIQAALVENATKAGYEVVTTKP